MLSAMTYLKKSCGHEMLVRTAPECAWTRTFSGSLTPIELSVGICLDLGSDPSLLAASVIVLTPLIAQRVWLSTRSTAVVSGSQTQLT